MEPKDPQSARAEIERTRARISSTIDEIEGVLLRKKARLEDKLDVVARIREKPLHAAGIVFGVGLLLGFLTGGGDDDDDELEAEARLMAEEKAALWESRARRLLSIARAQEEEIEELESAPIEYATLVTPASEWEDEDYEVFEEDDEYEEYEDDEESGPSRWSELRDTATERFGEYLSSAADRAATEFRRRF